MSPDQVLPVVLIVVMVVVAIVLALVGVQLFLTLRDLRRTVSSVDDLVNNVNEKIDLIINPIRTLGGLATGVAGGLKTFQTFSTWLKNRHEDKV